MPKSIDLTAFATRYAYAADSEELRLLTLADQACNKDGLITVAELKAALAAPTADLVSTEAVVNALKLFDAKSRVGRAVDPKRLPQWARALAAAADATYGNSDGKLSKEELTHYQDATKLGTTTRLTSQRLAILVSQMQRATGGKDLLDADGGKVDRELDRKTFRAGYNDALKIPLWVSYSLSAADAAQRKEIKRLDAFRGDPELVAAGVGAVPAWYLRTGYEMGHQKPFDDYDTASSARDSFLMSNIAPQTPELNGQSWRVIEDGVRQLVSAAGAKASVFTGALFLDATLQPLPPEQIQRIGPDKDVPNGKRTVAVPTHYWKTILLTLPDGKETMFSYLLPNKFDLPTKKDGVAALLSASLISGAEVERLSGLTIFKGLSKKTAAELKAKTKGLEEAVLAIAAAKAPVVTPAPREVPEITPVPAPISGRIARPALAVSPDGAFAALAMLWPDGVAKPHWVR